MEKRWIRVEYQTVNDLKLSESEKKLLYTRHGDNPAWYHVFFSWKPHETVVFGKKSVDKIIQKHPECHIYYRHMKE